MEKFIKELKENKIVIIVILLIRVARFGKIDTKSIIIGMILQWSACPDGWLIVQLNLA